MEHVGMHRRSALQLCLARYRSRSQWLFSRSQQRSEETQQTLYGRLAPVSLPSPEQATLEERRWSKNDL